MVRFFTGLAVGVGVIIFLTACGANADEEATAAPASTAAAVATSTSAPEPTAAEATPTDAAVSETETAPATEAPVEVPEGHFRNPVLDHDFPDPDILQLEGEYYAYATNSDGIHVQAAYSTDLINWDYLGEAFPTLPAWAIQDFGWTWAPEVSAAPDGNGYIMYFTTRFKIGEGGGTQCIGVATAESPRGPFTPVGDAPLVCPVSEGGAIDAATFVDDDGTHYLLWKNDGNSQGGITYIYIQPLSADGLSLEGEPTRLIKADQRWEGVLVEGPTLWKQDGKYYLFYSANDYASPRYAAGVAIADSVLGPYEKVEEPVLESVITAGIVGPGGQDVVTDAQGRTWILFHGWNAIGVRVMHLARLEWQDGIPVAGPFSRDPLPGPAVP